MILGLGELPQALPRRPDQPLWDRGDQFTTNHPTLAVAGASGALLRLIVNQLLAGLGTTALTQTHPATFCMVASTRLADVNATPVTVAVFTPEGMVTLPLRENRAGPSTCRAFPPPVCSASTPTASGYGETP